MIKKTRDKIKQYFREILEIKTTPSEIAAGFSVGTAIALLPTFGLGIFIGLFLIFIFKKISKISMFIAFAFWNPLTLIGSYSLSYAIGDLIFPGTPTTVFKLQLLNQIYLYSRKFLVGNIIVTIIFTTLSYLLVYFLVKKYQKKEIPIISE